MRVPNSNYRNDPSLVQACLTGDSQAWSTLVERYAKLVYSIPLRYGLSVDDANDVFQNVFARAYGNLTNLRNQSSLSAWLITITHHETQRFGRKNRPSFELDETIIDSSPSPAEHVGLRERRSIIQHTFSELDRRCQQLLTYLFFESDTPSYEAIAARLGISVGSIGPNRARCLKKLEALLKAKGFQWEND